MKVFAVVLVGFVVAVLSWLGGDLQPDRAVSNQAPKTEHISETTPTKVISTKLPELSQQELSQRIQQAHKLKSKGPTPVMLTEPELQQLKLASDIKRKEINELLKSYNQQQGNSEQKQRLKAEIERLTNEYNELLLPIALKAMEQKSNTTEVPNT